MEEKAHKVFDSAKNWSIMISDDLNDMRNEIMRQNKTEQIKRRLKLRVVVDPAGALQNAAQSLHHRKEPENEQAEWKDQFTDFVSNLLTKSSVGTTATQLNSGARTQRAQRTQLLAAVQRDPASDDVKIRDIAEFVKKDLRSGWRTAAD